MIKRRNYIFKTLKPIRCVALVSIILPMLLSTLAVADQRVNRFFSFIMFASSLSIGDVGADQLISKEVKQQSITDVTIDNETLKTYDQDFIDYYHDKIFPRISNLEHHILGSAINMISPKVYVIWTEGLAPSERGGNEFLYVISTKTGSPKILYSTQLDPRPSSTEYGYRNSVYWSKPNNGCGDNNFITGILQYSADDETDKTFIQSHIEYNQSDNAYRISISTSPVLFPKPICMS